MRVLYVASDVSLAAADGGAVHVREVAAELARLGHEVRVVVGADADDHARGFEVRAVRLPSRRLRLLALPAVERQVRAFRPDVVIERYYNFGGEGVIAARRHGVPVVIEVNSPMVEYAGSAKERLDRALGSPLRRWRGWMARRAAGFVTPTAAILPRGTPAAKVHVLPWGANTDRFRPDVEPAGLALPEGVAVFAFVASFRAWHGAERLVDAAALLERRALFLMIGDGPERTRVERRVAERGLGDRFYFRGAVANAEVPALLRLAVAGVAPFDTARHRYLEIDFYWCPLKILEAMAMALPVVTIDTPALARIVRPEREGLLVPEGDPAALAAALRRIVDDPEDARRMGRSARARVTAEYSWRGHAERLSAILEGIVARPRVSGPACA